MRHRKKGRKLGRTAEHRRALMRNLATQLLDLGAIQTTMPKAKELRGYTERLITTALKGSLAARRQVLRDIKDEKVVHKLFATIAPRYSTRPGGYTRVLRMGMRYGDKAQMALIQLVEEGDSLQPRHGKRRKPRADDPNAPLEVKRQALKFASSAADESAETEAATDADDSESSE